MTLLAIGRKRCEEEKNLEGVYMDIVSIVDLDNTKPFELIFGKSS
jgi:hypothetical protein